MTEFLDHFKAMEDRFWFEPGDTQNMQEVAEALKRFIQDLGVIRVPKAELHLHCEFDLPCRGVRVIGDDYISKGILRDFFSYLIEVEEYRPKYMFLEGEVKI